MLDPSGTLVFSVALENIPPSSHSAHVQAATHREAVVNVLGAGLCNTGVRQIHFVEDKGLWRRCVKR